MPLSARLVLAYPPKWGRSNTRLCTQAARDAACSTSIGGAGFKRVAAPAVERTSRAASARLLNNTTKSLGIELRSTPGSGPSFIGSESHYQE